MAESTYSLQGKRVWVAGHRGMAGSAILRRLAVEDCHILTVGHGELDLRRQADVEAWMGHHRPQAVFLAAAKVGGILANFQHPAEFLYDNLAIQTNVIHTAWQTDVEKLVFLGSSCIYPRDAAQPIVEDALMSGPLETTNDCYSLAKITGIRQCQAYRRQYGCDFIAAMPTNLYGPNDRYDLAQSHVVAALIMKIHQAKVERAASVTLWGSGTPKRELLYSEDLADALVFLVKNYSGLSHVNVGTQTELTIRELAETLAEIIGWQGVFTYDTSKPDGTPRKVMDVSMLTSMGWRASTDIKSGMRTAYEWYLANQAGSS